jgi:hypothetical protein
MKTREKEFNQKAYLMDKALEVLNAARNMQDRIDTKLQYNLEVAEPNGFTPFTDEQIDTCVRGRDRLHSSFENILNEILKTK